MSAVDVVAIVECVGKRPCAACGGDVGAACDSCGGCGSLPPSPVCVCDRSLTRQSGWHFNRIPPFGSERLPVYFCGAGHQVAVRFLPAPEPHRRAA